MVFATDIENRVNSEPATVNSAGPGAGASARDVFVPDFSRDLHQISLALALLLASLLCFVSINDFRTSLSLLHSAASLWPRCLGCSLHAIGRGWV